MPISYCPCRRRYIGPLPSCSNSAPLVYVLYVRRRVQIIKHAASRAALFMSTHLRKEGRKEGRRRRSATHIFVRCSSPTFFSLTGTATLGAFAYYLSSGQRNERTRRGNREPTRTLLALATNAFLSLSNVRFLIMFTSKIS